jgi:carboxyl-terminal processing protease
MQSTFRRPLRIALLSLAFVAAGSGWVLRPDLIRAIRGRPVGDDALVENVLGIIREHYADSLGERDLRLRAVEGILRSLPDKYSSLLTEGELKGYRELLEGSAGDVGLRLLDGPLGLTVEEVGAGSPAAQRGVRPGDRVLSIEDAPTRGWSALRGEQALRGEPGSALRIGIRHPGESGGAVAVLRRERSQRLLPLTRALGPGIGYLRLGSITRGTADAVSAALSRLVNEGARAVVLDLRNNPGGLLSEATTLLDRLLDAGAVIGTVEGRGHPRSQRIVSTGGQRWPGVRLVVLVNAATASAAEIIAAGVKDNGRGTVVGEHTYGKGIMQSTVRLASGAAVRISTARWITPSGSSLNGGGGAKGGIEPNLVVPPWHPSPGDWELADAIGARTDQFRQVLERAVALRDWIPRPGEDSVAPGTASFRRLARRLREAGLSISAERLSRGEALLRQEYAVLLAPQGVMRVTVPSRRPPLPDAQLAAAVQYLQNGAASGDGTGTR